MNFILFLLYKMFIAATARDLISPDEIHVVIMRTGPDLRLLKSEVQLLIFFICYKCATEILKQWGNNFKPWKFFAFSVFQVLAHEQIKERFMALMHLCIHSFDICRSNKKKQFILWFFNLWIFKHFLSVQKILTIEILFSIWQRRVNHQILNIRSMHHNASKGYQLFVGLWWKMVACTWKSETVAIGKNV